MPTPSNPTEIAREAFRRLATRRIPPTPDNYHVIYTEVSGVDSTEDSFPEKQLKIFANALPRTSPDQMRLGRELDESIRKKDWNGFRNSIKEHIASLTEIQRLNWAELIEELLRQWESKSGTLPPGKKREALEHVLNSAISNPATLFSRLQNLTKAWSQGGSGDDIILVDGIPAPIQPPPPSLPDSPPSRAADLLPEFRELFAFTLESAIGIQLAEHPQLDQEVREIAAQIRKANNLSSMQELLARLKRFAFKLELLAEDQAELKASLLKLLRLVVENISELVLDDQWLFGQMEIVRNIVGKPLSQRTIDDAEQRLKEVIFKQGQLKHSLKDAKDALKSMLAGFVDHLADFAGATSVYHDKIESYAGKISAANDITQLENVLAEVMQETRNIQINALRSRDELTLTQQKVRDAEARIITLEKELEETSQLVRYDQLTGALNRRGLEEMFDKEIARARRRDTPLCVGMLDIDNFKKLNDSLGHDAGDAALIHLAQIIRETLRPQDTVARFGGEEFIILFPESDLQQGTTAMIRVQRELTRRIFLHQNQKILITFSAGVTELQPGDNQNITIKRADEAMYQAKQTGKNKVMTSP